MKKFIRKLRWFSETLNENPLLKMNNKIENFTFIIHVWRSISSSSSFEQNKTKKKAVKYFQHHFQLSSN